MDPIVRLCFVEVREPDMHEPSGDLRRLIEAVETQWPDRVTGPIRCDLHVIRTLHLFCVLVNGVSRWHYGMGQI